MKNNKKKTYEIEFEDQGQDFLKWIVEWDIPGYSLGVVKESDMQNSIWTKYYVLSGKPEIGQKLQISTNPDDVIVRLNYKITAIKELENEPTEKSGK